MRFSSLACGALLLAAPYLAAQTQTTDRATAVHALKLGQYVRVDAFRTGRVRGRFVLANDTTLTVASHGAPMQIRVLEIERLWVRGRATGKGALIGAGVGILAGVVYGVLISSVACEPLDGGDCTTAGLATTTGLIGGAGGAVLGAGVGFVIPVWRLRFP